MKKYLSIILIFLITLTSVVFAKSPLIEIDGKIIKTDVSPFIDQNRTYVPIRFIGESLNYKVDWDANKKLVTINNETNDIKMTIGDTNINVNGKIVKNDVAPLIRNNRTFVPLRFVAETMNLNVKWDNEAGKVIIKSNKNDLLTNQYNLTDEEKEFINNFNSKQKIIENSMNSLKKSFFDKASTLSKEDLEKEYNSAKEIITKTIDEIKTMKVPDKFKDTYNKALEANDKALTMLPDLKEAILNENEDVAKKVVNLFTDFQIKMTELQDAYNSNLKGESYKAREDIKAYTEKADKTIDNLMKQIGK